MEINMERVLQSSLARISLRALFKGVVRLGSLYLASTLPIRRG